MDNVPAVESLITELCGELPTTAAASAGDEETFSIAKMMENLRVATLLGQPYEPPITSPIRRQITKLDGWDEQIPNSSASDAGDQLIKRFAGDQRRQSYREWMQRQLALGETVDGLVKHARKHDEATALFLEEIAAEL
jgi:hypothetical protein